MFTRAGYNLRGACRWKVWAMVHVHGGTRRGWAQVVEFGCGDLAWYSPRGHFLIWGLRAHFINRIWPQRGRTLDSPYSDVDRRELHWYFRE